MPQYHLHADHIKKGQGRAADLARYIAREDREQAVQLYRYIERDGATHGKEDFIAGGSGNLPAWTHGSAALFWDAADVLERKNGDVARTYELALPRELSPHGREELAADIREVLMGTQFAHSWAIHEPMARDGSGPMPHMHLMFSPRRQDDDQARTMEQWFKQVNHGGVKPDESWKTKGRLYDVRAAVELLSNAALAREGITAAVSCRSLESRGLSRDPARYEAGNAVDTTRTQAYRQQLRTSGTYDYEQWHTYMGWQDQRAQLPSIDRQVVLDRCRDHVWRYDRSPSRELERAASMSRTLDHAMLPAQERSRSYERSDLQRTVDHRDLQHQLHELEAALEQADEAPGGPGLRVRLWEREQERERDSHGYGF